MKAPAASGLRLSGVIGAAEAGFDHKIGPLLLGLEGSYLPISGLLGDTPLTCPTAACGSPLTIDTKVKIKWIWTASTGARGEGGAGPVSSDAGGTVAL